MLQDIRIRQRDYLIELAQILTQELDLNTLLWELLRISTQLIGGESGLIALYSDDKGWQIRSTNGLPDSLFAYIETYLASIQSQTQEDDKTALLEINLLIKRIRSMADLHIADGIGLPLTVHGKVSGIIIIFRSYHASFSVNDRKLLKAFTDQASIAVNNAYLYSENVKEKNRLNAIIESAADGIIVMDVSHRVRLVNAAMLTMLGIKDDSLINMDHDDVIQLKNIRNGMELTDGEAGGWPFSRDSRLFVEGDLVFGRLANKPLPVSITYSPVMSEDNVIQNIIGMVQDISKFREADELKNTFISTVSHELKTPVAIIKGYASTLRLDDVEWKAEDIRESLAAIEDEADRLTELINDLLDASRLYSGAVTLEQTDINLAELAKHVANRMQAQTGKHIIRCNFPHNFPIIYGDENRIEQVISNLVSNAIKYSKDGTIEISGKQDGEYVTVSVTDEGKGLLEEDIPHLFERFYRSKATINQAKGVGLGLFLCNAIIKGHGGSISAENRSDRPGSIFSFSLPIEPLMNHGKIPF